jgi:hypothetical protein
MKLLLPGQQGVYVYGRYLEALAAEEETMSIGASETRVPERAPSAA